jgi:uncharacterized phage-associated protein
MALSTANNIAKYLVELSARDQMRDPEQTPMTALRLQKLLYYIQGWSLARLGEAAFADAIQAWKHGPVVPTVYDAFKSHGAEPIPSTFCGPVDIDEQFQSFIASVWEDYKSFSAIELRQMTHSEPPYIAAWAKRARHDWCDQEITIDSIRDHFRGQAPKLGRRWKSRPENRPDDAWFDEPSPFAGQGGR